MKKQILIATLMTLMASFSYAADYTVDTKGAHASINFKVKHMGFSWLTGRFNTFDGEFSFDDNNVAASKITINIDTASVDSNHAERDKHLRSGDFLDVKKFPTSKFVSTKVEELDNGKMKVTGDLTLHGVTKSIVIDAVKVGEGDDPWGGHRAGFAGEVTINADHFDLPPTMGPGLEIAFELHVEGTRK